MNVDLNIFSNTNIYIFFLIIPFLVQLGVFPIGVMFFILLAGANSESINELIPLFLIIFFSSTLGDISAFLIARYFSKSTFMKKLLKRKRLKKLFKSSKIYFKKRGSIAIFITRFLITGIGPYINYIVGLQRYEFKKFTKYVILGEMIYSAELLIIGYIYKDAFFEFYNIIYIIGLILLVLYILYEWKKHFFSNKQETLGK